MNEEKQIEEMAMVICTDCVVGQTRCKFYTKPCDVVRQECEVLYKAGYRKQSEWISVEDRLPEIEGKYLVFTNKGGYIFACYYYKTNSFGFEHWDVTHWMPLPEAPKMKGGEE
jgi:hypothetical protein